MKIKSVLQTGGLALLCSAHLSCAAIFNAIGNEFAAEHAFAGQARENLREHPDEIKVITYNLAHCRGPHDFYGDGSQMDDLDMNLTIDSPAQVYKCLDDVAEMIVRENADIVLLQEVDKKAVWSYDIDFTPYLAGKTGLNYYAYGPNYDFVWWPHEHERANGTWIDTVYFNIGNAIISRYPIVSAENKAFEEQGFIGWIAGEHRYLDAVIDINGGQARFVSTHFGDGGIESEKMIEEAKTSAAPFVFGGTLHLVMPGAEESCEWCDAYAMPDLIDSGLFNVYMKDVDVADSAYFTSDTENMYWTADYIIPTSNVEIKDYYVVDAGLSDHKPVAATLIINDIQ